ncbi:hypothetical protein [Terricaulis sp.]|uniref:hypothetical protein n=1 Tax=Terricaulis sp. TaxID=2768686 RepID=UPI0037852C1C
MRTLFRNISIATALALAGVGALGGCNQQQQQGGGEQAGPPSNEEREAQLAAEQLAALGGAANAATRANYEGEFQASGGLDSVSSDEGAWELTLLSDYAQFSRPGLGEDGAMAGAREYHQNGMRVVAGPLTITLMMQTCQTGNQTLPYTAYVLFEGVAYQGCARRGAPSGERGSWASVLPELIPAIDACMARVSARPARVTIASALDEGQVSVRIRESDGSRRECIAPAAGGTASVYEPVSDLDRRAGENDPEFQRGGSAPRAENCRTVEEATTSSGQRLGWLIRRSC